MEKLEKIGFSKSADCIIENNCFEIKIFRNNTAKNILYAFIVCDNNDFRNVRYIGKTSRAFSNRMRGYQDGNGVATNNRVHSKVVEYLNNGQTVEVWCFNDNNSMLYHELQFDMAAAIENSLIEFYSEENKDNPLWNIANNKYYKKESNNLTGEKFQKTDTDAEVKAEAEEEDKVYTSIDSASATVAEFSITLGATYYNKPFINIPSDYSENLQEGVVSINLMNGNEIFSTLENIKVNRNAVPNGIPRLYLKKEYLNWIHKNFQLGENLKITILNNGVLKFSKL